MKEKETKVYIGWLSWDLGLQTQGKSFPKKVQKTRVMRSYT